MGQFFSRAEISAISFFPMGFIAGSRFGKTFILQIHRKLLRPDRAIITARKIWDYKRMQYHPTSADCPLCGTRFSPPESVLVTIEKITSDSGLSPDQSPCLELPEEVWEEPGLRSNCPQCSEDLKFNPFIADNY
jgi:hypothetical protein